MAKKTSPKTSLEQIGETAGLVWHILNKQGSMSLAKLVREADESRDLVMQALGWLSREGKVAIEDKGRARTVSLTP